MPQGYTQHNQRLAKNTIILYIRMVLTMLITLYTSRVILNMLGIQGYGLYNLVAGVVSMFLFLNTSMSSATSRFITCELGLKEKGCVQDIFSAAITVHFVIALTILIFAESIGLWIINTKLLIEPDRLLAANWLYQFSILTMIIQVCQVPYTASVIANERMDAYAVIEIINVILKLVIAYLICLSPIDNLIFYGMLLCLISIIIFTLYHSYCSKCLRGCSFLFSKKTERIYPMLRFSGWDLYGNASLVASSQGINMILNVFFGTVLNAASGIAAQVNGGISQLSNSINIAVRPQIIKSYVSKDFRRMFMLMEKCTIATTLLLLMFIIPLELNIEFVLKFWLGELTPQYSNILCKITLISVLCINMCYNINTAIHATGNIKKISFLTGSLYMLTLPVTYLAFTYDFEPQFAYIINIIALIFGLLINTNILSAYVSEFKPVKYLSNILIKTLGIGIFVHLFIKTFCNNIDLLNTLTGLILSLVLSVSLISFLGYILLLNKEERKKLIAYLIDKM